MFRNMYIIKKNRQLSQDFRTPYVILEHVPVTSSQSLIGNSKESAHALSKMPVEVLKNIFSRGTEICHVKIKRWKGICGFTSNVDKKSFHP